MNLESAKISIEKNAKDIFSFLSKVENFEKLMPESIEKFESLDEKSFLFQLKNMPVIKLELKSTVEDAEILLGAKSDKLPFTLKGKIDSTSETSSDVQLFFEGQFNAMMSMMIKSPIQKFIDTLAENIKKV